MSVELILLNQTSLRFFASIELELCLFSPCIPQWGQRCRPSVARCAQRPLQPMDAGDDHSVLYRPLRIYPLGHFVLHVRWTHRLRNCVWLLSYWL